MKRKWYILSCNEQNLPTKAAELLLLGRSYFEISQYSKAIEVLSEAIEKDPTNREAYFYLSSAYFETGNFDAALLDFANFEKEASSNQSTHTVSDEFTNALINSACQGAIEGAKEFVPSLCYSAFGLHRTLWAIHPLNSEASENIKNFASACFEMGSCTAEYCKNFDWDTVDEHMGEIKQFYEHFDRLSDTEKGELIGYSIGKYGVDIFAGGAFLKAGGACVKGISAFRNLKNINNICNLEAMTLSSSKKESMIASALEHSAEREAYFKNVNYNFDSHNKHVVGHNDYDIRRSIWLHEEPESLLKNRAGTGHPERGTPGSPGYKETVDFVEIIGIWKSPDGTIQLPTTRGTIHYGKKGAHIVPANPEPKIMKTEGNK